MRLPPALTMCSPISRDAGYVGVELLANDGVDRRHVFGDRGEERADERLGVGRTDVLHELFRMVEWVRVQV